MDNSVLLPRFDEFLAFGVVSGELDKCDTIERIVAQLVTAPKLSIYRRYSPICDKMTTFLSKVFNYL